MEKPADKNFRFKLNEFTVLGGFAFTVVFMLLLGLVLSMNDGGVPGEAVPNVNGGGYTQEVLSGPAPTAQEYETEVASVMQPFLSSAVKVDSSDFAAAPAELTELVDKTQERLLRVRVPKESRDAHLSFALLLDQWKRALAGNSADQEVVAAKTEALITANPWLLP